MPPRKCALRRRGCWAVFCRTTPASARKAAYWPWRPETPPPGCDCKRSCNCGRNTALKAVVPLLADKDPFLAGAALAVLGKPGHTNLLLPAAKDKNPALRLGALLALRRAGEKEGRELLPKFLADDSPEVRRAAIQWVGEERLKEYKALLRPAAARAPVTRELFEALLASTEFLAE